MERLLQCKVLECTVIYFIKKLCMNAHREHLCHGFDLGNGRIPMLWSNAEGVRFYFVLVVIISGIHLRDIDPEDVITDS